ncbi:hypothetical protein [Gemmata sp. SH-PL17]|uniref:hypothetical protein n=1 Tax=Gemmata sp. SH-PL17 TaxID=1630693 RepID=UPI0009EE7182|nr:hypothetical protein [Gemmata sp. SH-PL17]
MPQPTDRDIAHRSLCLAEPPYLKYFAQGRFREWRGVALIASVLPGPGFNFASVLHGNAPALNELLPVAREFFAGCEQGWGILVEGDAGHPMEAELLARGWAVAEDEPAYVLREIDARAGGGRSWSFATRKPNAMPRRTKRLPLPRFRRRPRWRT